MITTHCPFANHVPPPLVWSAQRSLLSRQSPRPRVRPSKLAPRDDHRLTMQRYFINDEDEVRSIEKSRLLLQVLPEPQPAHQRASAFRVQPYVHKRTG